MLKLQHVSKTFLGSKGAAMAALRDVSLAVPTNELVAIVGPSGCGKSTLLNLIAGFERPTSGSIKVDGQLNPAPGRDRGIILQHYSSFPWMTVADNIGFGLKLRGLTPQSIRATVDHYLAVTGLKEFRDAYPTTLSGGMRQRVALARTLANEPQLVLLDEPFGALDAQTRGQMQEFLVTFLEQERRTMVLVTHDIEEAIYLADRVLVLSDRPGTIRATMSIDLPRPRLPAVKVTKAFQALKGRMSQYLESRAQT